MIRSIRRLTIYTVISSRLADEPTTQGPRKDDMPTRDADDYKQPAPSRQKEQKAPVPVSPQRRNSDT